MWVSELQVRGLKGFASTGTIKFSKTINLLVGPNNSGKSTLIKALYRLQNVNALVAGDIRRGASRVVIEVKLQDTSQTDEITRQLFDASFDNEALLRLEMESASMNNVISVSSQNNTSGYVLRNLGEREPANFIFPYSARRKVLHFNQEVNLEAVERVVDNLSNLYAKVDSVCVANHWAHQEFMEACKLILDLPISTFAADSGKKAGLLLRGHESISLDSMGDGVAHLLGLIVALCTSKGKLFLIEELENDIHPKALKELLKLVARKSSDNQFIISTHSNIVAKYLGSEPGAEIFAFTSHLEEGIPTSRCVPVEDSFEPKRSLLESLGYELEDFNLWKAWLFLEESSCERIIVHYLLPWFAPKLVGYLRTLSAGGATNVEPKFNDFNRLFLFTHLGEVYHGRAWVLVDGDDAGKNTINSLKSHYGSTWDASHFRTLSRTDFEHYFPARFDSRVSECLSVKDKSKRRESKKELLHEVLTWISENESDAKAEFKVSAEEIIRFLQEIESSITPIS